MDKLVVHGGSPLEGPLTVGGSKNTALPLMAATLLAEGTSRITNVPDLRDVRTFSNVIRVAGPAVTFDAATRADLVLDLHQGSTSRMIDEVRVRCGRRHRLHDECLALAKAFDSGYVLDQKGPEGQLARTAPDEGVPTIDPELGGCVGWDQESIEIGVEGVFNVLEAYDFLPDGRAADRQTRAKGFDQFGSPAGGVVRFQVELGDRVSAGDLLFEVTDVFGETKARVTANNGGIFWRTRRLPQVATGEYVCSVGTNVDTY